MLADSLTIFERHRTFPMKSDDLKFKLLNGLIFTLDGVYSVVLGTQNVFALRVLILNHHQDAHHVLIG